MVQKNHKYFMHVDPHSCEKCVIASVRMIYDFPPEYVITYVNATGETKA